MKNVEVATRPTEIKNLKKLTGYKHAYRIKIRDYRIGMYMKRTLLSLHGSSTERIYTKFFLDIILKGSFIMWTLSFDLPAQYSLPTVPQCCGFSRFLGHFLFLKNFTSNWLLIIYEIFGMPQLTTVLFYIYSLSYE